MRFDQYHWKQRFELFNWFSWLHGFSRRGCFYYVGLGCFLLLMLDTFFWNCTCNLAFLNLKWSSILDVSYCNVYFFIMISFSKFDKFELILFIHIISLFLCSSNCFEFPTYCCVGSCMSSLYLLLRLIKHCLC